MPIGASPESRWGSGQLADMAGLRFARFESRACDVYCASSSQWPGFGTLASDWQVCLQLSGNSELMRGADVCALSPGGLALNALADGYRVRVASAAEHLVMVIPRERVPEDLRCIVVAIEDDLGRLDGGAARLFADTLRQLAQELGSIPGAAHEGLADLLLSLLRASLLERASVAGGRGFGGLLYEQAVEHLCLRFHDPDLSLDDLARAMGCTKRHLHGVFRDVGRTPAKTLLDLRMAHCTRALRDPTRQKVPITTLAIESGFREPAHFGRLFRQRHGMTPQAWRRAQASDMLVS